MAEGNCALIQQPKYGVPSKVGLSYAAGLCMAAAEAGTHALLPHVLNKNSQRGRVDNWGL